MSPLPGGSFVINEQATFAPDSNHRWMGSAAMDSNGNIAVGYSVSSSNTFPSIRYVNPPPKGVKDRGCGTRKPDGTLGNPVQTDALGDL